jgi:hypothetical protein
MRILDDADHQSPIGGCGQKSQRGECHQKPIRAWPRLQSEGDAQCSPLRLGQQAECAQQR